MKAKTISWIVFIAVILIFGITNINTDAELQIFFKIFYVPTISVIVVSLFIGLILGLFISHQTRSKKKEDIKSIKESRKKKESKKEEKGE